MLCQHVLLDRLDILIEEGIFFALAVFNSVSLKSTITFKPKIPITRFRQDFFFGPRSLNSRYLQTN